MEQLWNRVEEVENLWHEKEEQRLAEVTEDGNNGQRHAAEVAEGVAREDRRRIPVVVKEGQRRRQVRQ